MLLFFSVRFSRPVSSQKSSFQESIALHYTAFYSGFFWIFFPSRASATTVCLCVVVGIFVYYFASLVLVLCFFYSCTVFALSKILVCGLCVRAVYHTTLILLPASTATAAISEPSAFLAQHCSMVLVIHCAHALYIIFYAFVCVCVCVFACLCMVNVRMYVPMWACVCVLVPLEPSMLSYSHIARCPNIHTILGRSHTIALFAHIVAVERVSLYFVNWCMYNNFQLNTFVVHTHTHVRTHATILSSPALV